MDFEYNINCYTLYRRDRPNTRGGGIIAYVKNDSNFTAEEVTIDSKFDFEFLILKIKHKISKPYYVITYYFRPNIMSKKITDQFNELMESFVSEECLLIGDFNIDLNTNLTHQWSTNISDLGFNQLITESTRIGSTLDHIYTNRLDNICDSGVLSVAISDHFPVFVGRKQRFGLKCKSNANFLLYYRSYEKLDERRIKDEIKSIDANIQSLDPNTLCNDFNDAMHKLLNKYMPMKSKRIRIESKDNWISKDIIQMMYKRDHLRRDWIKAKQKGLQEYIIAQLHNSYKDQRNRTRYQIRKSKQNYMKNRIMKCEDNQKMWKILRDFIPNKSKKTDSIPLTAKQLNDSFIDQRDQIIRQYFPDSDDIPLDFRLRTDKSFTIPNITADNIREIIARIPKNKATGSDGLPSRFLVLFIEDLIPILLRLYNLIISKGIYPFAWKIGKVSAILKNGSKHDWLNYRPITVLPFVSKVFEKHIFGKFYTYLNSNQMLSPFQFGFQKNHSTIDALLTLQNNVVSALNNRKKVLIVSLDLKKAFDVVSHSLLYAKLFQYGCDQNSMKLFHSYLENRQQFVRTQTSVSDIRYNGSVSVVQGSIGGPLLFLLFINDIAELPLRGKIILSADDTTLTETADSYEELENNTNFDLSLIYCWLKKNRLILNSKKSCFMIMGRPLNMPSIHIQVGSESIDCVTKAKILGIIWSPDMTFKLHINDLCKTIANRLSYLWRISDYLTIPILKHVFNAIVLPAFDYGCALCDEELPE